MAPWVPIREIELAGPAGEPVDLRRLLTCHGVASLPPMRIDTQAWTLEVTLPLDKGARTVRVQAGRRGFSTVQVAGSRLRASDGRDLLQRLRRMLSLEVDLSPFYRLARKDPELSWVCAGAGRMIRGASVFEDVIKTVCTTNCSWSGTVRMVSALVEHLGARAEGAPPHGPQGRAFPTPQAMAAAPEGFYRSVARAGYRAASLKRIAAAVAEGSLDLESLGDARSAAFSDDEVALRLRSLPGIGPYAAAHIGLLLGRTSTLILDSWTRPTYARLRGRGAVSDRAIQRRFARYGPYAGLAFWMVLTRDWMGEMPAPVDHA